MGQADKRREKVFGRGPSGEVCIIPLVFFSAVETPLRVDVAVLKVRARLLQKYLCDEQKELQALYALQALVVTLEQPASKSQAARGEGGTEGLPDKRGYSWRILNPRKWAKTKMPCWFD